MTYTVVLFHNFLFWILKLNYSESRLMWSIWDRAKSDNINQMITICNLLLIQSNGLSVIWDVADQSYFDHVNRMITLSVLTLSGFYCNSSIALHNHYVINWTQLKKVILKLKLVSLELLLYFLLIVSAKHIIWRRLCFRETGWDV